MQLELEKYRPFYQLYSHLAKWHHRAQVNAASVLVETQREKGEAHPRGMKGMDRQTPLEQKMSWFCYFVIIWGLEH